MEEGCKCNDDDDDEEEEDEYPVIADDVDSDEESYDNELDNEAGEVIVQHAACKRSQSPVAAPSRQVRMRLDDHLMRERR